MKSPPRALPWFIAFPLAAIGGYALDLATPAVSWWPAGLLGVTFILAALWQQRAFFGFMLGLLAGCAFWLPHISWLTLYLGPIPWLALSTVMIFWFSIFGLFAALATRGIGWMSVRGSRFASPITVVFAQSLTVAGLWVLREQVQSTWPYGGFAWGRIAHTQADGPLVALVSWLGFAAFGGVLVVACGLVVGACLTAKRSPTRAVTVTAVTLVSLMALSLIPIAPTQHEGILRVAAVQGNSKSAIFDDRENGDVFRDHADATRALLNDLEAANDRVDVIIWPENSGEFALPDHTLRALEVQQLSRAASAPIVAGTILQDSDEVYTNSSVVFDEEGFTGKRYDKRRPVPFAEYMPNRAFFRSLVPDLVDLVQLDYAFGTRSAVLPIDTASIEVLAGIAICFDIIFDDHAVAMMSDGAEVIFAQTNNADFGRTDESAQQLQIAKLRAVESGRALINISTVGTSSIVLPDGSSVESLEPFTSASMVADVPLVSGLTPALRFGAEFAAFFMVIGCVGLAFAAGILVARRRESR